jgi:hypothetical protein
LSPCHYGCYSFGNHVDSIAFIGKFMASQVTAGRAAASLVLKVLRGVLGGLAKDGKVSLDDIDRAIALIERGTVELDRAYEATHKRSLEAAEQSLLAIAAAEIEEEKEGKHATRQGGGRFGMRSDPLHRLLALPLEKMFYATPPSFERKWLSAYFATARQLIGPQIVAYDAECKAIIQSMLAVHGQKLNWDTVYVEPRTVALMRRTFGAMAGKMSDGKGAEIWTERMAQPAADGSRPSDGQIAEAREVILTFFRTLPPAP